MPAKDVKAYVKRKKNDAADTEAICEAVLSNFVSPNCGLEAFFSADPRGGFEALSFSFAQTSARAKKG